MIGENGPVTSQCSRAGCLLDARWNVNWRNPRIHGLERVKIWLACDEHVDYLNDYLSTRGFPVVVSELAHPATVVPDGASQ
ncbi:MAG: hypothetical protein ACOH1Z_01145 [Rhodoglobus sp.]